MGPVEPSFCWFTEVPEVRCCLLLCCCCRRRRGCPLLWLLLPPPLLSPSLLLLWHSLHCSALMPRNPCRSQCPDS